VANQQHLNSDGRPKLPKPSERMSVVLVDAPHPATVAPEDLLAQCKLRTQRRSGPGGQHRNKTSSGAFLLHEPTGLVGEATERRSQADNRAIALRRLRFRLAIEVRTPSPFDGPVGPLETELREGHHGKSMKLNEANESKPAFLALVLNDLHACGGQPSVLAPLWSVTTSGIVGLLKSHPPAFALANAIRAHHGLRALGLRWLVRR
jgi:hypothetical protein